MIRPIDRRSCMEDLFSIHPVIARGGGRAPDVVLAGAAADGALTTAQIAAHPLYPSLLAAYIDCRKVGAPPEVSALLDDIHRTCSSSSSSNAAAGDPELNEFMESYRRALVEYKGQLSKPLDEASSFIRSINAQLSLGGAGAAALHSDHEGEESSEEELSCFAGDGAGGGAGVPGHEVKDMLLRKYSGCLGRLRTEFVKKRKKGKLPAGARSALLEWWSAHYRWPYPTEEDKVRLAAITGLEPKQINNWFINQRKRHWKPSEDMRFALLEGVAGDGSASGTTLYFDTGFVGP